MKTTRPLAKACEAADASVAAAAAETAAVIAAVTAAVIAALTVAVIALCLAMSIASASHIDSPQRASGPPGRTSPAPAGEIGQAPRVMTTPAHVDHASRLSLAAIGLGVIVLVRACEPERRGRSRPLI